MADRADTPQSTRSQRAPQRGQPDVVLLATLRTEAAPAGFCGSCLRVREEARARLVLYADVRPAALQRTRQQLAEVSTLLCRYYARQQDEGQFVMATNTLLCPQCLALELSGLSLPYDMISRMQEQERAACAESGEPERHLYGVFLHFVDAPGSPVLPVLVLMEEDADLTEELAMEREHGFPHPAQQGMVLS